MNIERLQLSIQTVKENIVILENQEPEDAGYYLQLEHEKMVLDALEKQIPKKPYLDSILRKRLRCNIKYLLSKWPSMNYVFFFYSIFH